MSIPVGTKGRADILVTNDNTAIAAGSGTLPVFATPWMAALMEQAAQTSFSPTCLRRRALWAPTCPSTTCPPPPWA